MNIPTDKTLKDLWYNYVFDKSGSAITKEERELVSKVATIEKELTADFTDRQKELYNKYSDLMNRLDSIFSERAFENGVRFATSYLIEALSDDSGSR